jgi:hypothetical protein
VEIKRNEYINYYLLPLWISSLFSRSQSIKSIFFPQGMTFFSKLRKKNITCNIIQKGGLKDSNDNETKESRISGIPLFPCKGKDISVQCPPNWCNGCSSGWLDAQLWVWDASSSLIYQSLCFRNRNMSTVPNLLGHSY